MLVQSAIAPSLLVVWLCSGCDRSAEAAAFYGISVLVEGDPATPVAAAAVVRDGVPLATTGADGRATLRLHGAEGEVVSLNVTCPAEYSSPAAPLSVSLHKLADGAHLPSYRVACAPQTRTVVVAVRASNGSDLPVLYLGKEIAHTDVSGVAHVQLHLRPGARFELALSTDAKPSLVPKNPSAVFVVPDHDDLLFFDQRFDTPRSQRPVQRGPRPF
jgi:hypothetical protein